MDIKEIKEIIQDKRFQWVLTLTLLLIIAFWTSSIRLSNWDVLNDQTTGEKIPSDLDAFYFLRIGQTLLHNDGVLPAYDSMRYPSQRLPFTNELLPYVDLFVYKTINYFYKYSLAEVNAFNPVIAFFISLFFFFGISYLLTESKSIALLSTGLLSVIPPYLQRTIGGFSDHDSLGMMTFFIVLFLYVISLKSLEKKHNAYGKPLILGALTALITGFAYATWKGANTYIYMIVSMSFLIYWLFNARHNLKLAQTIILYHAAWIVLTPLSILLYGFSPMSHISSTLLSHNGLINSASFGIILFDFILLKYGKRIKSKWYKEEKRLWYSIGLCILAGLILFPLLGINLLRTLSAVWTAIFHPWGTARISLTVAENAQPYLVNIIGMISKPIFWMFVAGIISVGILSLSNIKDSKKRFFSYAFWIIFIFGSLFSRISASSVMQGTNAISQFVYISSILGFLLYFLWIFLSNEAVSFGSKDAFLLSLGIFVLITARASMRHILVIVPLMCLFVGYGLFAFFNQAKKKADQIVKIIFITAFLVGTISIGYQLYTFEGQIRDQAPRIGPSANYQWQKAMAWVRENTPENAIFIHWWDYGYWVQYLGQRPSITDGGHGVDFWDHLIGRYLLTSPEVDIAFSLMKSHKVTHLLIDPSDLGKYPAYSIIGSDSGGKDRYSAIPVILLDPSQTKETSENILIVYNGGVFLDEDIIYSTPNGQVFLPAEKAGLAAIILRVGFGNGENYVERPMGVYGYNGQRYDLPIRYVYLNGELIDSGDGIEAVVRIIPSFDPNQGVSSVGAAIYLSPKVARGLFAQLYLLDNSFGKFDGLRLVHSEDDFVVQSLRQQGAPLQEFIYYGGFRGPIKIWEVDYPDNIIEREEFLRTSGEYAEFDNLKVTS